MVPSSHNMIGTKYWKRVNIFVYKIQVIRATVRRGQRMSTALSHCCYCRCRCDMHFIVLHWFISELRADAGDPSTLVIYDRDIITTLCCCFLSWDSNAPMGAAPKDGAHLNLSRRQQPRKMIIFSAAFLSPGWVTETRSLFVGQQTHLTAWRLDGCSQQMNPKRGTKLNKFKKKQITNKIAAAAAASSSSLCLHSNSYTFGTLG